MKIKGFTLVELLAIIALLAVIVVVTITTVSAPYQGMRKDLQESQIKLIESATETYIQKYKNEYPSIEGNIYCISLKQIVEEGLLEDHLINAMEDAKIDLNYGVKVTVESKVSYQFEFDSRKNVCSN